MKEYVCTICGYVYSEAGGSPESGIAPGTKWEALEEDWACPICGAAKSDFEEQATKPKATKKMPAYDTAILEEEHDLRKLSPEEMSALFSNLAKACEKQYLENKAESFFELANYYASISKTPSETQLSDISALLEKNLMDYTKATELATAAMDRGALRALVWGEKATKAVSSILARYEKQKGALIKDTNIYVCDICGFIYVGDEPPQICPVCKVPSLKIKKIEREAV